MNKIHIFFFFRKITSYFGKRNIFSLTGFVSCRKLRKLLFYFHSRFDFVKDSNWKLCCVFKNCIFCIHIFMLTNADNFGFLILLSKMQNKIFLFSWYMFETFLYTRKFIMNAIHMYTRCRKSVVFFVCLNFELRCIGHQEAIERRHQNHYHQIFFLVGRTERFCLKAEIKNNS